MNKDENCFKFQNGKIYKIVNDVDNEIYVGSTIQTLSNRIAKHRNDAKKHPRFKIYQKMNELGIECFRIVLIENYPCKTKDELRAREEHWRSELKASLNSRACVGISKHQYYIDNIDKFKKYKQDNKNKIKAYTNNYNKKYRNENKDYLKNCQKQKVLCNECLSEVSYGNMARHKLTPKHSKFIELTNNVQKTTDEYNSLIRKSVVV